MAENTKRSIWSLHGITGMIIAVILLLSILVFLQVGVISATCSSAVNPYDAAPIREIDNLKAVADRDQQRKFSFQSPAETKK